MFDKLGDLNKAAIFSVFALSMPWALLLLFVSFRSAGDPPALVTALFGITNYLYMFTPAIAVLIMLLIVTRDGHSKGDWKALGLHRLRIGAWWIAVLAMVLADVIVGAVLWSTPSLRSTCRRISVTCYWAFSCRLPLLRRHFRLARRSDGEVTCSPTSCVWGGRGLWR